MVIKFVLWCPNKQYTTLFGMRKTNKSHHQSLSKMDDTYMRTLVDFPLIGNGKVYSSHYTSACMYINVIL